MKDLIKQKVIDYTPELLKYLDELVSYPSVFSDDALPFGQANIDCLNHALEIGSNLGFKAVNVDNYAGYSFLLPFTDQCRLFLVEEEAHFPQFGSVI